MIKQDDLMSTSLNDIYREIIQIAGSVGECKSSIDHLESMITRSHLDIKEHLVKIDKQLSYLDKQARDQEQRRYNLNQLLQFSIPNMVKWTFCFISFGMVIGSGAKASNIIMQLWQHYIS